MKTPDFLKVPTADIGRVGFDGAAILALVRYVTALAGEHGGRITVDGKTWWRATHAEMGEALGGVHRKSVGRALLRLESAGAILAIPAKTFNGDRAQAYRVPDRPSDQASDQPLDKSGQGSDQPLDESGPPSGRIRPLPLDESGHSHWPDPANLPITRELEEGGRSADSPTDEPERPEQHRSSNAPPPEIPAAEEPPFHLAASGKVVCAKHVGTDGVKPCHDCGRAREAYEADRAATAEGELRHRAAIRAAIDACTRCDDFGRLDDLTDCPAHSNFRRAAS